jgi:hypothetical protein
MDLGTQQSSHAWEGCYLLDVGVQMARIRDARMGLTAAQAGRSYTGRFV